MSGFEKADYCITVDFERGTESPARVFRTMTGLIEAFQGIDHVLVESVDVAIRPVMLLEDVETGSLKAWLRAQLERTDDADIQKLDWQAIVGKYLVRAKYALLDWTKDRPTVTSQDEIRQLQNKLHALAEETGVNAIPAYALPNPRRLLVNLQNVHDALAHLRPNDVARLSTPEGDAPFNVQFTIPEVTLDEIMTREVLQGEQVMIVKIKKPDFLGDSQWEFRHRNRAIPARVNDHAWLARFRNRQVVVQPGDALRVRMSIEVPYGHDGEALAERYVVEEVLEIVDAPEQRDLL